MMNFAKRFSVGVIALSVLFTAVSSPGLAQQTLEQRVIRLEERLAAIEQILTRLTGAAEAGPVDVPPTTVESGMPISISLISKGFREGDFENYITLEFEFTSALLKPVRAFTGVVVFQDLFDRDILRVNLTIEEALEPGGTTRWSGSIDYNQFRDTHQRLRSIAQSDLQTKFEVEAVIYQDGTRQQFGEKR